MVNLGHIGLLNFQCALVATMAELKSFCWLVKLPCFVDAPSLRRWGSRWTSRRSRSSCAMDPGDQPQSAYMENTCLDFGIPLNLWTGRSLCLSSLTCDWLLMATWIHDLLAMRISANRNLPSSLWMTTSRPRPMPMVNYLFHVIYFEPATRSSARPTTSSTAM